MEKTASEIATVKRNVRLQEWNRQIEEQKSSGQSMQEWCKQKGINPKTYYYHLRKVREEYLMSGKGERTVVKYREKSTIIKRQQSRPDHIFHPLGQIDFTFVQREIIRFQSVS